MHFAYGIPGPPLTDPYYGVPIGWRKYLNECTPFGYVSVNYTLIWTHLVIQKDRPVFCFQSQKCFTSEQLMFVYMLVALDGRACHAGTTWSDVYNKRAPDWAPANICIIAYVSAEPTNQRSRCLLG